MTTRQAQLAAAILLDTVLRAAMISGCWQAAEVNLIAAVLLDAQAEGLVGILPTEGTWPDIYEVQEQITRLRAEAEALRKKETHA